MPHRRPHGLGPPGTPCRTAEHPAAETVCEQLEDGRVGSRETASSSPRQWTSTATDHLFSGPRACRGDTIDRSDRGAVTASAVRTKPQGLCTPPSGLRAPMPSSAPPRLSATSITSSEAMSSCGCWVRRRRYAEPARQRHWLYRSPPVRPVLVNSKDALAGDPLSCPTDHRTWLTLSRRTHRLPVALRGPPRDPSYQMRAPERRVPVAAPLAGSDVHGRAPLRRARRGRRATACGEAHRTRFGTGVSGVGPVGNAVASYGKAVRAARGGGTRARALITARDDAPRIGRQLGGEATRQQSAGLPGSPPRTGYGRSVSSATCLGDGFPGRRRRCAA